MKKTAFLILTACTLLAITAPACGQPAPAKLRVACDAAYAPFEMISEESKQIVGFDADLMQAVADKAGLDIEMVNVGFDSVLAGISQCQYDMAISSITITDERKKTILFSDPYYLAGQIVSVRTDSDITGKDDLTGKKLGVQLGTTGEIEAKKIQGANIKTWDDVGLAFQALIVGQVDAVIADNPVAQGYAAKHRDKIKTVGPIFTDEYYGIAVCNNKAYLVPKVNAALKALKDEGFMDQLSKKWVEK